MRSLGVINFLGERQVIGQQEPLGLKPMTARSCHHGKGHAEESVSASLVGREGLGGNLFQASGDFERRGEEAAVN